FSSGPSGEQTHGLSAHRPRFQRCKREDSIPALADSQVERAPTESAIAVSQSRYDSPHSAWTRRSVPVAPTTAVGTELELECQPGCSPTADRRSDARRG